MVQLRLIDAIILIALIALILSHFDTDSLVIATDLEMIIFFFFGLPVIAVKINYPRSDVRPEPNNGNNTCLSICDFLSISSVIHKFDDDFCLIIIQGVISLYILQFLLFDFIAFDIELRRISRSRAQTKFRREKVSG